MSTDYATIWGNRIKARRAALGLRQVDFRDAATAIGTPISQQSLSAWESGRSLPRDEIRPVIARILGLDTHALFSYDTDDERVPA